MPSHLAYDSKLRRRLRQVARVASGTAVAAAIQHRPPRVVRSFWWDGHLNFGDALTPWLLPKYGYVPFLRPAADASVIGVGSILEMVPQDFAGLIWGSGLMYDAPRAFPKASALAVRGDLTRQRLGLKPSTPLGDPGLLIAAHVPRSPTNHTLAVVPHGFHANHPAILDLVRRYPRETVLIDVADHPRAVAKRLSGAAAVITSSLHGLIFADSFGIPASWITLKPSLYGGEFKFLDHESVTTPAAERRAELKRGVILSQVIRDCHLANQDRVAEAVQQLTTAAESIAQHLP